MEKVRVRERFNGEKGNIRKTRKGKNQDTTNSTLYQ